MKKITLLLTLVFSLIIFLNYVNLQSSFNDLIKKDIRNDGIRLYTHYDNFINPSIININFWNIDNDKTMADMDRIIFQLAEVLVDKTFEKVIFSFRFDKKYFIRGDYFKKIGEEFSYQNKIYLIRSFPEKLYKMDGSKAFSTWTGGLLGVMTKQMEDHNEFHKVWYLEEWAKLKM